MKSIRCITVCFLLFGSYQTGLSQQVLNVEKIMRDPKWIGSLPEDIHWGLDGKLYFNWNPLAEPETPVYCLAPPQTKPEKVDPAEERAYVRQFVYDPSRQYAAFEREGDLYYRHLKTGKEVRVTRTAVRESNPRFSHDSRQLYFQQGDDLFAVSLDDGMWTQLTAFSREGRLSVRGDRSGTTTTQNQWLADDQLALFDVLRERKQRDSIRRVGQERRRPAGPRRLEVGDQLLSFQQVSPDGRYVTYRLTQRVDGNNSTVVPNYVTATGYTENIPARSKVGGSQAPSVTYIYDRMRDTVYAVRTSAIPGISDLPDFWNDYPEEKAKRQQAPKPRQVHVGPVYWNDAGTAAFVTVTANDNKDRWIMRLDPADGSLHLIDRQRDEAWIAGPGIGSSWGGGSVGWLTGDRIYFQSEASGYSHLYTVNIRTGEKRQLTSGSWEVSDLRLSTDKRYFYFTANKKHPGIRHYYRLPVDGGEPVQLTSMDGGNEVELSPDEKWLAIRYSYTNKPWELYLQPNQPGAKAIQVTSSLTEEFNAYSWKEPEVISFKNRYGSDVYARLYRPDQPKSNRPAVIFVHGAGYLQNAHYWWSQYFREYMFHNLLVDLGYTVLDIDYTGSAGYGRDHRTGIYRHMGGKDLTDQVDGAKLLVERYGVNPKNIGIYGGSYGGFITLMAMFTEPGVFAAGAALRSVTDWAHYNHGYTSNILNTPAEDPIAYRRSSPIYFADGLQGHLLMCHGMVDVNVHFQDIVRLSQRLIELGKENWELAVYPVEDHGFVEPSSWTDEYKRILKLFEERLTN